MISNAESRVLSRADFRTRDDTRTEPHSDPEDDTRVEPNATSRDAFSAKYRDPALGVPWVESSVLSLGETPDGFIGLIFWLARSYAEIETLKEKVRVLYELHNKKK